MLEPLGMVRQVFLDNKKIIGEDVQLLDGLASVSSLIVNMLLLNPVSRASVSNRRGTNHVHSESRSFWVSISLPPTPLTMPPQ